MPIDHPPDSWGIIYQTKGKLYDNRNRYWFFGNFEMDWFKDLTY